MSTRPAGSRHLAAVVVASAAAVLATACSSWTLQAPQTVERTTSARVAPTFLDAPAPTDPRTAAVVGAVARAVPALAGDRAGRLVRRADDTCADVAAGKPRDAVVRAAQGRFVTTEVPALTLDEARRLVEAVTAAACPTAAP